MRRRKMRGDERRRRDYLYGKGCERRREEEKKMEVER